MIATRKNISAMKHLSFYQCGSRFPMSFVAVTRNAVILWSFFFHKNESLRTVSNHFLASLSVEDFLVGLVIDPVWIIIRCWIQPPGVNILCDFI